MTDVEKRINELSLRRSEFRHAKNYRAAVPIQLELIELLEENAMSKKDIANAHNYASVLYMRCALFITAEWHARRALSLACGETIQDLEARATYNLVLAHILAAQYRFDEALPHGESAVQNFRAFHNPPDKFLSNVIDDVERIRNRTWSLPPD